MASSLTPLRHSILLDWLARIVATEAPPPEVIAFNIGLFETEHGYAACFVNCKSYDSTNDDWACDEDFFPKERYCDSPLAKPNVEWQAVRDTVAAGVRAYLATPDGKSSSSGVRRL